MSRIRVSKLQMEYYCKISTGHPLIIFQHRAYSNSLNSWLRLHSNAHKYNVNRCISQPNLANSHIAQQSLCLHRVSKLVSVVSQQPRKVLAIQSIQINTSSQSQSTCYALRTGTRHLATQAIEPKPAQSASKECPTTPQAQAQAEAAQPRGQSSAQPEIKVIAKILPKSFSDPPLVATAGSVASAGLSVSASSYSSAEDTHEAVMDEARAMREFMLTENDLERIPHRQSRNPYLGSGYDLYGEKPMIFVYRREDVKRAAYEKYGGQHGFEQCKASVADDEMLMRNSVQIAVM